MPIRVEFLHSQKLIKVVMDGPVTLKDMQDHFDKIVLEKAMGYAKLVDCRGAQLIYNEHDVLMMGARLSVYTATLESGPLAVIGGDNKVAIAFSRFVNVSPSKRPASLFKTEAEAIDWLATQQASATSSAAT